MSFRPLSQRTNPDPSFEGPHDGIPTWMLRSVQNWLERVMYVSTQTTRRPNESLLLSVEQSLHVSLDWTHGVHSAFAGLLRQIGGDGNVGLDLLDFLLAQGVGGQAASLNEILTKAGSVWEVAGSGLTRRSLGPVREAIEDVRPVNDRAHAHLLDAWAKLMGRNPDPSSAYREAIRAVEVVAAPVVTPADPKATLGKIIKAINDKPEKWTVDLAEASPSQVADMAAMIWQAQFDRHGNPDEDVPLNVSQEQADAAVHVAIALVRLFAGGHIRLIA